MKRTLCFGIALMLMLMTVCYPVSAKGGSKAATEAARFFAALDILPAEDTAETETVTRADARRQWCASCTPMPLPRRRTATFGMF